MIRALLLARALALSLLTACSASRPAAEVAAIPISQLAQDSDVIVVARVTSVSSGLFTDRVARAVPLQKWKGHPEKEIEFLASPTWSCDITTAIPGETALLFLKVGESGQLTINHSGRGRMPVRRVGTQELATLFGDIRFPEGTVQAVPGPGNHQYKHGVELNALEQLVNEAIKQPRESDAAGGAR
jgi:hypothetical protein